MQPRKSTRHVNAANARWRTAKADAERAAGIFDRGPDTDSRQPFLLPLAAVGYHDMRIEPRRGYVAWRAVREDTGQVLHCAALKELLRWVAGQLPRQMSARSIAGLQDGYSAQDETDAAAC